MIKENELKGMEFPGYRLAGDEANCTFDFMKDLFEGTNNNMYKLPIAITSDQIKSGGLLNSKTEDCIVISNTDHTSGYFKYCITMRKQINTLAVDMWYFGTSTLTAEKHTVEERTQGGLIGKAINMVKGFDQRAYEEEYAYYGMLEETFKKCFNS